MKNTLKKNIQGIKVEEFERAYERCLVFFYAFPTRTIGLSELSLLIKSSKTATKKAIETLVKQDFLKREIVGKAWILSVNQNHFFCKTKKVLYHIDKLYESGIIEDIYDAIPQARSIILFGSYRYGSDIEESDIDLAVEVLDNYELQILKVMMGQLGYRKNIPVNVHVFSRNKIDLNLFANIANGFILDGFLEVRP